MTTPSKPFVWVFVHYTKRLCKTITKHQGVFLAVLATVITNPADYTTVQTMIAAVVSGCAVLDRYYPDIPA